MWRCEAQDLGSFTQDQGRILVKGQIYVSAKTGKLLELIWWNSQKDKA